MSQIPDGWVETALEVTGRFESFDDPWGGVSGDFDRMGISLGVLQWNIGMGSLQPMVRALGQATVKRLMPDYGGELWTACNSARPEGLKIVRAWKSGSVLHKAVLSELKAFTKSPEFIEQQIAAADVKAERAYKGTVNWATAAGADKPTLGLFCWFFDVVVQLGGLNDLTIEKVRDYIAASGADKVDDLICDWLEGRPSTQSGAVDAKKNAKLWRDKVAKDRLELFVLSYMRATEANQRWTADVLNRKATIAMEDGWVHQHHFDLSGVLNPKPKPKPKSKPPSVKARTSKASKQAAAPPG